MNLDIGPSGTRSDPHRQARDARRQPLLLHSLELFGELFTELFAARTVSTVVEVGVETGGASTIYADLGAKVYCVEPAPDDRLRAAVADDPRLALVEGHSPDALAEVPPADLYVLDGDHNYAVARAELEWIVQNAPDAVVVMHDVLWPSGRRDSYYQPSPLPEQDRHPDSHEGPTVWHEGLTGAGFVGDGAFTTAERAGGERNGVLTAIEDVLAEAGEEWRFGVVPAVFGLGVLARRDAEGTEEIFRALRPYLNSPLLTAMENNRIALYTRGLQLQHELEQRAADADRLADIVSAQQEEIERLRGSEPEEYAPVLTGYVESVSMHEPTWGSFLEPDPALHEVEDLPGALGIGIVTGHRANLGAMAGRDPLFDRIAARIEFSSVQVEDQCSAEHYFDVFSRVQREHRRLTRLVDVGVFMGSSACLFAGCAEAMGLEVDLVDVNAHYLRFSYERLRRTFPSVAARVRMFHGDLPTYAATVLAAEPSTRAMVHHDGSHHFVQVVKDLSALYFVRDRVHALAVQDTHLRGRIQEVNFVDAAMSAMFGNERPREQLGVRFTRESPRAVLEPNPWNGNYFLPGQAEGQFLLLADADWKYPHPSMQLADFLPVKAPPAR
ncbi:class I SAM-dependent methyltransferase [Spirillospora sp. NPDC127200]